MSFQARRTELRSLSSSDPNSVTTAVQCPGNWTVKEAIGPARPVKTSNIVWPSPVAPLPAGVVEDMGEGGAAFEEQQKELRHLWRHTPLNRYYLPISKLPPLGGPDPRQQLSRKPPACCPQQSVTRVERVIARWHSLPHLRRQLPPDALEEIVASSEQTSTAEMHGTKQSDGKVPESMPDRRGKSVGTKAKPHFRSTCATRVF